MTQIDDLTIHIQVNLKIIFFNCFALILSIFRLLHQSKDENQKSKTKCFAIPLYQIHPHLSSF